MGENNNINIFLLGYPIENATALGVLESNIVSRNPIELNFTSSYPESKKINGFVDLYYFQNPLLTIQQEDIVDLMNKKISRNVGAKKLVSDNLCYQTTSSGIEIFYLMIISQII